VGLSPFVRAPESARVIYLVIMLAAGGPLLAGLVFFGWRSLVVSAIAIGSCAVTERLYYRLTHTPAMLGRTHGYMTGLLLALTLPAFAPWYVPLVAGVFAILLGKAIFGGVGHFLWQPALVGRLAVAVLFPAVLAPAHWPLLTPRHVVRGDLQRAAHVDSQRRWAHATAPGDAHAILLTPPRRKLSTLGQAGKARWMALAFDTDRAERYQAPPPTLLLQLPALKDLLYGARPGGIGETCTIALLVAGIYLIYRNYIRWQLPLAIILAAAGGFAVAPIRLFAPGGTETLVWLPALHEGLDVGFTYVNYQLLSGQLILTAFFLAPEMTSRPVTAGGQTLFGIGVGLLTVILTLYFNVTIPAYMAVLAMNTFTPVIDTLWRPPVLGQRPWYLRLLPRRPRKANATEL
jgi:electron transport complex protein RnfD